MKVECDIDDGLWWKSSEEKKPEVLQQSVADFHYSTTEDASNACVDTNDTLHTERIEQSSDTDLEQTSTTTESQEKRYPNREH